MKIIIYIKSLSDLQEAATKATEVAKTVFRAEVVIIVREKA